jgi:hypothetical protein
VVVAEQLGRSVLTSGRDDRSQLAARFEAS